MPKISRSDKPSAENAWRPSAWVAHVLSGENRAERVALLADVPDGMRDAVRNAVLREFIRRTA